MIEPDTGITEISFGGKRKYTIPQKLDIDASVVYDATDQIFRVAFLIPKEQLEQYGPLLRILQYRLTKTAFIPRVTFCVELTQVTLLFVHVTKTIKPFGIVYEFDSEDALFERKEVEEVCN